MLISTETIQWSKIYLCNVVLVMLKLFLSCVNIRSNVFPLTCVGSEVCFLRLSALIVSLKTTASALDWSSMWILKSPSKMLFWYWGSLLVSSSVMSLMNIPFVLTDLAYAVAILMLSLGSLSLKLTVLMYFRFD